MKHSPRTDDDAELRWSALLAQVGSEIAGPLTAAVERVSQLAATGRIDRPSLRALRSELDAARHAAMLGQQLARYASGRVRQCLERVELAQAVRDAAAQRSAESDARGLQLRLGLTPAEVVVDPTLLFTLLHSVLEWALALARGPVELRLEHKAWPAHARLAIRFVHRPADEAPEPPEAAKRGTLDTLPWRLARQIADVMGLLVERHDDASETLFAIEFPRTVNDALEGASVIELHGGLTSTADARPLAGSHVLVVEPRRDMGRRVRDAIAHMGFIIDIVGSIDEARRFCATGLPHAIVHASALGGERLDGLQDDLKKDAPSLVFVEIVDGGGGFQASGFHGASCARVGRDALEQHLPSALVFELSKTL